MRSRRSRVARRNSSRCPSLGVTLGGPPPSPTPSLAPPAIPASTPNADALARRPPSGTLLARQRLSSFLDSPPHSTYDDGGGRRIATNSAGGCYRCQQPSDTASQRRPPPVVPTLPGEGVRSSVGEGTDDVSDWLDGGGSGTPVDVPALLDSRASELLGDIVGAGALLSLGLTSDRGALGVTVTVDGRWRREYFRDSDALTDWLTEGLPAIRAACEETSASSARRKRQRSPRDR